MSSLTGKVAIITGAAGGLGTALAHSFAREGCRLFLTDVRQDALERLRSAIAAGGTDVRTCTADLTVTREVRSMIEQAVREFETLDILVNNAGISATKSFWDLEEADWDYLLQLNVKGVFFALQAAARHLTKGGGSIINIASVAGRLPRPCLLPYAASKAAVISITRSAALLLAGSGIRVNAIAPGMMDTDMLHGLQSMWNQSSGEAATPPSRDLVPLGRIAQPAEIAAAAVFLASDSAAYITGQTLNVCGGIVMS
jgi:NAD(P)-dependent dehydrogenase (short-subunit alcohol dehydrogenase family)